jgi:putative ATPase
VISALLSRVRVFVLEALTDTDVHTLVRDAAGRCGYQLAASAAAAIVNLANGDARAAYNLLEMAAGSVAPGQEISDQIVAQVAQKKVLLYDKSGEEHYNIISALHKSIRNSDADAALYWLARMLEGGEDPMYVVRRLVRFASEDVGLANPAALGVALDTRDSIHFLGMPEAGVALAQCVIYLASSPKSNSAYRAYSAAMEAARASRAVPVPLHLRNAPTRLMEELEYGKGYQYAHDVDGGVADMACLPDSLAGRRFYQGREVGRETEVMRRLEEFKKRRTRPGSDT